MVGRIVRSVVGSVLVLGCLPALAAGAASAGAPGHATWAVSAAYPGDTGVRYTWTFATTASADVSEVTFAVPPGTAGAALDVADAYGLPAGGTASLAGTTVTYRLPAPTRLPADVVALVAVDGFTNTATAGRYPSAVTARDGATVVEERPTDPVVIDAAAGTVTAVVPRVTSLGADAREIRAALSPVAGAASAYDQRTVLEVRTNASGGYTLSASATALQDDGATHALSPVSAGVESPVAADRFPANRWGYALEVLSGEAGSSLVPPGSYVGYTAAGEVVRTVAGPTADRIALDHRWKIDRNQPTGTYRARIVYTVVPGY